MNPRVRHILFLVGACATAVVLVAGLRGLPPFGEYPGPYGDVVMARVVQERHTEQAVAAVTFDYRGVDTMGEELMLFAAVAGVVMLLRRKKGEKETESSDGEDHAAAPPPSAAVVMLGTILFPVGLVAGAAMVLHGHLTPGGGFQGGVLSATAFLFVYLTGEIEDFERFAPDGTLDLVEATGAAGYVIAGLSGLIGAAVFLQNFLPLGEKGKLLSAGLIPLLNVVVGVEVTAGIMLILAAFLRQALEIRRKGR